MTIDFYIEHFSLQVFRLRRKKFDCGQGCIRFDCFSDILQTSHSQVLFRLRLFILLLDTSVVPANREKNLRKQVETWAKH